MRKYLPLLKRIRKLGDRARLDFIKKCNKEFLDCVSECAKNVLKGNVPLQSHQLKSLRRDKNNLRALALKNTTLSKKRRILQKGGFLGALLTPILSFLASLLAGNASG